MRTIVLALTLLSQAFAPAPFPKADREPPRKKQERLLGEYRRRLDELGVEWRLEGDSLRFNVNHPGGGGGMSGSLRAVKGDLPGALRHVIRMVGSYFRDGGMPPP